MTIFALCMVIFIPFFFFCHKCGTAFFFTRIHPVNWEYFCPFWLVWPQIWGASPLPGCALFPFLVISAANLELVLPLMCSFCPKSGDILPFICSFCPKHGDFLPFMCSFAPKLGMLFDLETVLPQNWGCFALYH